MPAPSIHRLHNLYFPLFCRFAALRRQETAAFALQMNATLFVSEHLQEVMRPLRAQARQHYDNQLDLIRQWQDVTIDAALIDVGGELVIALLWEICRLLRIGIVRKPLLDAMVQARLERAMERH
jgi:hypothetical protein